MSTQEIDAFIADRLKKLSTKPPEIVQTKKPVTKTVKVSKEPFKHLKLTTDEKKRTKPFEHLMIGGK